MFRGSPYSHLMIPMPGFYDYGAGGTTSTAVAPHMVAEPKAKAAAARGAGSQVSQYSSNFRVARWSMGFTRYTHSQVTIHNYA